MGVARIFTEGGALLDVVFQVWGAKGNLGNK